jgi:hypothetical protein
MLLVAHLRYCRRYLSLDHIRVHVTRALIDLPNRTEYLLLLLLAILVVLLGANNYGDDLALPLHDGRFILIVGAAQNISEFVARLFRTHTTSQHTPPCIARRSVASLTHNVNKHIMC